MSVSPFDYSSYTLLLSLSHFVFIFSQWRRNESKVGGGHRAKAKVGAPIRRKAPENFLVVALKAHLVVLVSAFVMVSTVLSVSCLLFFYSRCPPCPAICKSGGARARHAQWSRCHCLQCCFLTWVLGCYFKCYIGRFTNVHYAYHDRTLDCQREVNDIVANNSLICLCDLNACNVQFHFRQVFTT